MPSKHINRKRKQTPEDEWAHVTKGVGEKIDSKDILDVQDRSITFKDDFGAAITNYEMYEEEKEKVQDEVGNTAQYIKFANESIKEKKNRMDRFQEMQQKFQDDIDSLQGNPKSKEDLDKIRYQDIKVCDVEQTLRYMQKERESIQKKMEFYTQQVSRSQLDLIEKDKEIAGIKAELDILNKSEGIEEKIFQKEEDPLTELKNKLDKIGNDYEKEEILKNLKSMVTKLSENNSREDGNSLRDNYIR